MQEWRTLVVAGASVNHNGSLRSSSFLRCLQSSYSSLFATIGSKTVSYQAKETGVRSSMLCLLELNPKNREILYEKVSSAGSEFLSTASSMKLRKT